MAGGAVSRLTLAGKHAHGLCFVAGTPKTPEATEALLERIGPVRHTHYGGFYDFVPDLAKADTAYTNLALAAHTDTTYFTEPAGLQAFHMLAHTPPPGAAQAGGTLGGQSLLVDGFHAARLLRAESPNDFDVLRSVAIPWHASGNAGVAVAPDRAYPVLEARGGALQRVRWNNDDRGVVPLAADADEWYRAARRWDEVLRRAQSEYWFQLEPGRVLSRPGPSSWRGRAPWPTIADAMPCRPAGQSLTTGASCTAAAPLRGCGASAAATVGRAGPGPRADDGARARADGRE